jgi:hypothetical protein
MPSRKAPRRLLPLLYLACALYFALSLYQHISRQPPWDYTVNWVAAQGLRQGISLYSPPQLHDLGLSLTGPYAQSLFLDPFTSYIGPPSTALLLLPLTFLPFAASITVYRVLVVLAFAASVYLAGLALPTNSRLTGWSVGGLALLCFQPVVLSLGLGQVDAFVMLALAAGVWAAGRERWWLAGAAIGFAALLKISPGLLLLYLLLRGKHKAVLGAAVTAVALLTLAALVGRPGDLWLFLSEVAPSLSTGSLHVQNQSLPAWLARLSLPEADLLAYGRGLGPFSPLGLLLGGLATLTLYLTRRKLPLSPLDYGFLVLAALLAGPLTWDHYTSWAVLSLVLLSDPGPWRGLTPRTRSGLLCLLAAGALLMLGPTLAFPSLEVLANPALRLLTGTKTLALLLFCAATLYLLVRSQRLAPSQAAALGG